MASKLGPRRSSGCVHLLDDQPKRIVQRYYEDVLMGRRLDVLDGLLAPGFVCHDPAGAPIDRSGYFVAVRMMHDGFGRLDVTIEDQLAERDRVTTRWSAKARHTGWFAGIPATDRDVTMCGTDVHRLDGGRLVELWEQLDLASLWAQLL